MDEKTDLDRIAVRAKTDRALLEDLIREYKPFIFSRVRRVAAGSVTEQDDVSIVGINAFYEAVRAYTPGKGAFLPFSALVIQRRVTDYMRKNQGPPTLSLDELEVGEYGEAAKLADKTAVLLYERQNAENALRDEIEELTERLRQRGVSMEDVYKDSPRHKRGRETLRTAIAEILETEEFLTTLMKDNRLLLKKISESSKVPRKKLESSRRYIIACVLIATGEFPLLKEYLYPEVSV